MAHMNNSYWTDSRTGHNVGKDELTAVLFMQVISKEPFWNSALVPDVFAEKLLRRLEEIGEKYRSENIDPDGYGIATIGTVARRLSDFCYEK